MSLGHEFTKEAQNKVIGAFSRHKISLHMDDGWMGGCSEVAYDDCINYNSPMDFIDSSYGGVFDDWRHIDLTVFHRGDNL
jgi:hypothetical protein